jgi:hypothetical protein
MKNASAVDFQGRTEAESGRVLGKRKIVRASPSSSGISDCFWNPTAKDCRMVDGGARDEMVICTKGGYLVPGAIAEEALTAGDVAGGMDCMTPAFLADQLERSRRNLGLETIDVYYLHNPETQLGVIDEARFLPVHTGRIRMAGNCGFRRPHPLLRDSDLGWISRRRSRPALTRHDGAGDRGKEFIISGSFNCR